MHSLFVDYRWECSKWIFTTNKMQSSTQLYTKAQYSNFMFSSKMSCPCAWSTHGSFDSPLQQCNLYLSHAIHVYSPLNRPPTYMTLSSPSYYPQFHSHGRLLGWPQSRSIKRGNHSSWLTIFVASRAEGFLFWPFGFHFMYWKHSVKSAN